MDSKSKPPRFEDVYRRYEFAPLVALAMTAAVWIKKRRADRAAKHRIAGNDGSSGEGFSRVEPRATGRPRMAFHGF